MTRGGNNKETSMSWDPANKKRIIISFYANEAIETLITLFFLSSTRDQDE
jgi:hypothetical protein